MVEQNASRACQVCVGGVGGKGGDAAFLQPWDTRACGVCPTVSVTVMRHNRLRTEDLYRSGL